MDGLDEDLLARLGKHKRGVGCLYVARLDDVDRTVLREMIDRAFSGALEGDGATGPCYSVLSLLPRCCSAGYKGRHGVTSGAGRLEPGTIG